MLKFQSLLFCWMFVLACAWSQDRAGTWSGELHQHGKAGVFNIRPQLSSANVLEETDGCTPRTLSPSLPTPGETNDDGRGRRHFHTLPKITLPHFAISPKFRKIAVPCQIEPFN